LTYVKTMKIGQGIIENATIKGQTPNTLEFDQETRLLSNKLMHCFNGITVNMHSKMLITYHK